MTEEEVLSSPVKDDETLADECTAAAEAQYKSQLEAERAMSDEFIRRNTKFADFEELVVASECQRPSGKCAAQKFDEFLKKNTKFANWLEMLDAGFAYYKYGDERGN